MSYWQGKRVLITGGSGFIGSHLTRRLVHAGAEVAITTKYNSPIDNVRVVDIWDRIKVIEADLRNFDSLRQIAKWEPQIIFHLAAYNHVGDSFTNVREAMESNSVASANLFECYEGYERFVYTSTSEVYGNQTEVPFVESMDPVPISPYSIGKYSGELYARMCMGMKDRPVTVVRPFNAFGPYQSPRAIISEMIATCLAGQPVLSTGGRQTRQFNYIDNLVDGFLLAGEKDEALRQIINLGSDDEIPIRDLIQLIHQECKSSSELKIGALPDRPTEIWRMSADNNLAKRLLGWQPRIGLREGIRRTVAWQREYMATYFADNGPLMRLASFAADDE